MSKYSNLLAVGFSLIMITPTSIFADDKTDFCDYVAAVVAGTAVKRNIDIPVEQARKDLQNNLQKYLPNISVYRVSYLMSLVDAVYKEPKNVSGKKLAETAAYGCSVSAYDKLINLERNQ
jgi:hypothetical protein